MTVFLMIVSPIKANAILFLLLCYSCTSYPRDQFADLSIDLRCLLHYICNTTPLFIPILYIQTERD